MAGRAFALGLDFGTNSVRALIVDLASGEEAGSFVHDYTRGEDGIVLDAKDPHLARQHATAGAKQPQHRWWFVAEYDAIEHTADRLAYELKGQGVKVALAHLDILQLRFS